MASRIQGITVEIGGDTTKLSSALSGVNKEIKNTQTQLKDVEKLLKLDPSNTELVAQKQKLLKDAIAQTKEKLDTLKLAAEQANEQLQKGEITQQQYDALQREIQETEQTLKSLEAQAASTNTTLAKIEEVGGKMEKVGNSIAGVGRKMSVVSAAIAGVGAAAVKTTAEFDSQMSTVKSISGATGEEFDALREKALEMGSKTSFSATEAGQAMEYMALLKHLDSLYLDICVKCPENPELHAGESVNITCYINSYELWRKTVNKKLTKPIVIGQRNLILLEEEQVRNVLQQEDNLPLCIVFVGDFLKPDVFKEMDHVQITASVIDRSQTDELYAYTGYADTAEVALYSSQAGTANHALLADTAQSAAHAYSAETAFMADNFFLKMPKELLNIDGKRYSHGMDTLDVPEFSPHRLDGGFQTEAEGKKLDRETGGFSDILHFHVPLRNDVSQVRNQSHS